MCTFLTSIFFVFLTFSGYASEAKANSSDASSTTLDFANGLYARKMYAPAISEYEKFIQANPASPEVASARFRAADSYYFMKDYPSAISRFKAFLKDFPKDKRTQAAEFRIATAHYALKNYPPAIRTYLKLSKNAQDTALKSASLFYLAKSFDERGKPDKSVKAFRQIVEQYPNSEYSAYAAVVIGDAYLRLKNYAEAARDYRFAADKDIPIEVVTEARFRAAEIYFSLKNYESAAEYYEKILKPSETTGDLTRSETQRISELKEKSILGLFYCDRAAQDLEKAQRRLASQKALIDKGALKSEILYVFAGLLADKKNYDKALQVLAEADKNPPGSARAYFEKAKLLQELGRDTQATRAAFLDYLKKYPSDSNAPKAALALVEMTLDAGDFEGAATQAQDFIKKYLSLQDRAYHKLGVALTGQKKYKEAFEAFGTVTSKYPESTLRAESLYGAAIAFENLERYKEALGFYQKIIMDFPDHPLYKEALVRLAYNDLTLGDFEAASALYQDILLNKPSVPINLDSVFWLLQYELDHGRYDSMREILALLPARFPEQDTRHEVEFFMGESSLGLKDAPKAIEHYSKAVESKPDGRYVPYAYLGLGIAYEMQNKPVEAENNFNKVLGFDEEPKATARARFEIANLRLRSGDLLEAAKAFMLVAIFYDDPRYTPVSLYKAGECFSKLNNVDEAQKAFDELRNRYPKSAWVKKLKVKK